MAKRRGHPGIIRRIHTPPPSPLMKFFEDAIPEPEDHGREVWLEALTTSDAVGGTD